MKSLVLLASVFCSANAFGQFLTYEEPLRLICAVKAEGMSVEVTHKPDSQFTTVRVLKNSELVKKLSGVSLVVEYIARPATSNDFPLKTIKLSSYQVRQSEKGYKLSYPSFGGAWNGSEEIADCREK